jgi:hypothetical protein
MNVDMLAELNRDGRITDDLPVSMYCLARLDGAQRNLVSGLNSLRHQDRRIL